ncbi:hypothetical protein [Wukongibacter sp. M2B1]|uniref:hypothetical protein n=1 Tax=Wukongibacter sp. M2B1 TaxID=3088895 RepID=UPI003D7AC146
MPEYTTNFNLEKPLQNEYFDIDIQNRNMDIIDSEFKNTNIRIDELASNEVEKGASKIGIHDADSNFIATDVEGALSELFTNVSNGKQQIATAITDVDNSLNPSGSDTFTQLANTIRNISTGKKFSAGEMLSVSEKINVTGLDFKPSIVVGFYYTSDSDTNITYYNNSVSAEYAYHYGTYVTQKVSLSTQNQYFNFGEFKLHVYGSSSDKKITWIAVE